MSAREATLARIRATGRLRLAGTREIEFDEPLDLLWHRDQTLPLHTNGMRFTALDANGAVVPGDLVAQVDRVLHNLVTALAAAGGAPEHLVKLTIFVADVEDYLARRADIGATWRARLGKVFPAMTLVQVSDFWNDGALIEIEGVAVVPA